MSPNSLKSTLKHLHQASELKEHANHKPQGHGQILPNEPAVKPSSTKQLSGLLKKQLASPVTDQVVEIPKEFIAQYPPDLLILLAIKEAERVTLKAFQGASFQSLRKTLPLPTGILRKVLTGLVGQELITRSHYKQKVSGQKSHTIYTLSEEARELIPKELTLKSTLLNFNASLYKSPAHQLNTQPLTKPAYAYINFTYSYNSTPYP